MPETTKFGGQDSASSDGALKPNTVLLARYKILEVRGSGGFGSVYQARDLNFPDAKRLVAVKEMIVTTTDPNLRASTMRTFQREANILATLSHPAIPKIYDFFDKNDRAYLVMEYINGKDLEDILHQTRSLPMDKILEWAIDLCDVLHYLHSYQPEPIIFRDMKPANIMIDSLGKARLIDFGIAKIFVSGVKQTMIGTEGYSAPEQYKGNANPLSDIYSLGATLHHVISRKDPRLEPPFSFNERPLPDFNPDATPELDQIIAKALEFDPEKRYKDCQEMKSVLEAYRYGRQTVNVDAPADKSEGTGQFGVGASIQPKWTFSAEDELRAGPVVHNGLVYFGSYDTNVWAVRIDDGQFVWKHATEGGIASVPVVDTDHNTLLFGSEDGNFYAVNTRDGATHWVCKTGDKIRTSGTLAHGHVFFGSDDGNLYAVLAANGRVMWRFETGGPVRSTPCVTNDRIVFGSETGEVFGIELNGNRRWSFRTKRGVSASPRVDQDGFCYIGSFDGFLYCIDADNGYSNWRLRTAGPIVNAPAIDDKYVYVGSADGKLYAVHMNNGKDRWTFALENPIVSSPLLHEGILYFGGTDNKLHAVNAQNGKELWQFETDGAITSMPAIYKDTILVTSMDRTIYALPLVTL